MINITFQVSVYLIAKAKYFLFRLTFVKLKEEINNGGELKGEMKGKQYLLSTKYLFGIEPGILSTLSFNSHSFMRQAIFSFSR